MHGVFHRRGRLLRFWCMTSWQRVARHRALQLVWGPIWSVHKSNDIFVLAMSTVVRRGPYMPGVLCAPFRPCMVLCSYFSARTGTPIIQALAGCFCNYVGQRRVLCTSRVHLWPSLQRIAHDIYPVNMHDLDSVGANWPSSLLLLVQFVHFHYYVKSRALRMFGVINGLRDWLMNPKSDYLCEDVEPECISGNPFQRWNFSH